MSLTIQGKLSKGDFQLELDLSLPTNGVIALFGASGCGKTTLLRVIAGLEKTEHVSVSFGNTRWQASNSFVPTHQRNLGFVFQNGALFEHLTVAENINFGVKRLPAGHSPINVEQLIELLDLRHLLKRSPTQLSGGERQRVAIARALAVKPSLLLMDEPLSALDQPRKREILSYLASLYRQFSIPIFYVTHAIDEVARLAHYVVLMDKGRVIAQGHIAQMLSRPELTITHGDEAAVIISGEIASHDSQYHLSDISIGEQVITVARVSLEVGEFVRLKIDARDVSVSLTPSNDSSILNILPAKISQIVSENESQVSLFLLSSNQQLLARITNKSLQRMNLKVGDEVFAQIKSIALLV